jgi:hypothetical protein
MKTFSIYAKDSEKQEIVSLKEGFYIEAFLFSAAWAFYKKMWLVGILSILILSASYNLQFVAHGYLSEFLDNLVLFAYGLLACDFANYKLVKSGYILQDIIIAKNSEEAELAYLRKIID